MDSLRQRLYQAADQGDALAGEALEAIRSLVDAIEGLLSPHVSISDTRKAVANAHAVLRSLK